MINRDSLTPCSHIQGAYRSSVESKVTWSIAQGMRHWMSFLSPNILGKVVLKDGNSLDSREAYFPDAVRIVKAKNPLSLIHSHTLLSSKDVFVEA